MSHRDRKTVPPSSADDQLLTVADVAGHLKVSESLIYQMVKAGKLPSHQIGTGRGIIRFRSADVQSYIDSSRVEKIQPPRRLRPKLRHVHLGERSLD